MSNKVITPETDKSGLYKVGELHVNGGIEVTVENSKKIEVEVKEYKICKSFWNNDSVYHFKNKTNLEVLDELFKENSCTFKTEIADGGDFILCRLVVLDPKKYDRKGTCKQIINEMQSEKSCNVTEDAKEEFKKEKGGSVSNKGIKKNDLEFKVTEQELPYKGNPNAKWVKVTHVNKDGETLMQGVAIDLYGSKEKAIEAAKEKIKSILKKESEKQELKDLIDLFKEAVEENPDDQESKDLLELYEENLKEFDIKFESGGSINRKLTYLGEVGGDKIGQKSSLEKAKLLEKKGISSEEIRQETGWFLNPHDKKWRFEISDEDFDVIYNFEDAKKYFNENQNKTFFKTKLSDVIKHDKLFSAYPEFKNISFYFYNEKKTTLAGVFIPENKEKEIFIIYNLYDEKSRIEHARGIKSTKTSNETWLSELLRISDIISGGSGLNYRPISNDVYKFRRNIIAHELQHLVQIREEFGAGSSSEWWYEEIIRKRGIDESKLSEIERNNLRIESKLYSKNSSGEIEAMDIDLRLDFNDKERKGIIPLSLVTVNPDFVTVDLEEPRFENGGELNAEEAIVNAPCINEKFKFVESSDYNEYRKGGSINSMTEAELKAFYNTKEGKELDRQTHAKWKKLVNMSKSELEKFYNSEEGKEAGLSASEAKELGIDSGRESARWIMKMKDIPYTEWTSDMWRWAKKQIRFISRMSGVKGDLYDDNGNKTPKHTALLIWGHNPEKYEDGGAVSFDKVISASTRFRPSETVVFDPPLEGKNGAKLISYTWSYEWTMTPNREGELKSKRISDWTQAEISADTGRDIVHQYTILMPDGEYKTVSSDSVPVLLGYLDKKELKSFPNLVTASKTLAKQQMQLAIMEAQKKEYDELYAKFEKAEKPEIKEVDETSKFSAAIESWKKGAYSNYAMGDIIYRQDNDYVYETKEYKNRPITKDTIEQLTWNWISERVKENGGVNPRGLYELKNRVARQKRKVENILNTKMENGGEVEDFDFSSLFNEESTEEKESRAKQEKISKEQEKEDWYQKSRFSKTWASTLKEAVEKTVKSYFDAKATYEDWGSREYKSNKGVVYAGGDDIHGSIYTIGGINENRRQRTMSGAKMQMDEAIEDLKELGLNKDEISNLIGVDKFSKGGNVSVNKVSVYQTNFSGLSFSDLGGYFDSNFTDVIDLEDKNVVLKDAPIFLFFKNPYDTLYSEKISIDDVIGAIIPKKMEKDARTIFDKRYVSYLTYNDYSSNEDKIEAIKNLADINEDIILK